MRFQALFFAVLLFGSCASAADKPVVPASDSQSVTELNNHFAADLYGKLKSTPGNLFFSPESISTALAMVYAGARGDTETEMAGALHYKLDQAHLQPAMGALLNDLNRKGETRGYRLDVADALWMQRGYVFKNDFTALLQRDYGAQPTVLDFTHAAESARKTINGWVEDKTEHKIADLLPLGALDANTRLVLTNAVYFKGDWLTPFDKTATSEADFHVMPGHSVRVPLMHHMQSCKYYDGGSFQAIELPYKGEDLAMIVLLPKGMDGLPPLEQSLTEANLQDWISRMASTNDIQLSLPKFKMTAQFELNDVLREMGVRLAFDQNKADFTGMVDTAREENLYLSDAFHKAYVAVDEKGTEAAAATGMVMSIKSAVYSPPVVFKADHPFLFMIRDVRSGSILFMGRMSDPSRTQ